MWRVFLSGDKLKFVKPALTFGEQTELLIERGLIVNDKKKLQEILQNVNYYRLSAYWYPFLIKDEKEHFQPGISFDTVWRRYCFDEQIRLILMKAVEYIEISILRTRMVELFSLSYGPFGYREKNNYSPRLPNKVFTSLIQNIDNETNRSREEFIQRYFKKYDEELALPMWIAVEVMTFGQLFTIFKHMKKKEKVIISNQFDLYPPVLSSWIHTLNYIRNACAHHARLWNRIIPLPPKIPDEKHKPNWYHPVPIDNRRLFAVLTLINYLLQFITENCTEYKSQLLSLFSQYPDIPLNLMGFPDNWIECPIWK